MSASSLQGPGQSYQVQDILTPYGPMNVAAIPLPAAVVQSMAQSITDVQDQIKPLMTLVSTQTSFSLGITEGDSNSSVGSIQIRNDGGFGSSLSAVATADVQWLTVSTPEIQNIARGETASFSINLVTDNLLSSQSPYVGHVNIQNVDDTSSVITTTVSVVVLPRPAISVNTQNVDFTWSILTPAAAPYYMTVSNSGPGSSSLNFSASKLTDSSWLDVSPASAGPLAAGEESSVVLSIVGASIPSIVGVYTETVRLSSVNASNSPVDVTVTLTVTA